MARTPDEMANELENSDVEVAGQMAEDLMAEQADTKLVGGDAEVKPEANAPVVVTETPVAKEPEPTPVPLTAPAPAPAQPPINPATEVVPAAKPAETHVSFLSGLDDTEDDDGGEAAQPPAKSTGATPGMIRDIQSERQRRKAAEQQAADLKRQLDEANAAKQTAGQEVDLNTLLGEGEDDDFVDRKTLKTVVEATARRTREITLHELQRKEQDKQAETAKQQRQKAMSASETAIRGTVKDYDAVVQKALELNVLTLDEKRAILNSPNPAGTLYVKSKQVLSAFGIQLQTSAAVTPPATLPVATEPPKQNEPSGDEIQSDEELYATLFPKQV